MSTKFDRARDAIRKVARRHPGHLFAVCDECHAWLTGDMPADAEEAGRLVGAAAATLELLRQSYRRVFADAGQEAAFDIGFRHGRRADCGDQRMVIREGGAK